MALETFIFRKLTARKQASQSPAIAGLQLQTSVYGKCIPVVYGKTKIAPNLIWYGDFRSVSKKNNPSGGGGKGGTGGGGGGKGGGDAGVTYTYYTSVIMALCEGPVGSIPSAYVDKNITTPSALGMTTFTGTYSQSAWSYMSTNHAAQALGYRGIAYVAAASYSLGTSAQLPNHTFEVAGVFSSSIGGQVDADASLVINDILTNTHYGVGFPSALVGSLTTYQDYTIASGLWISPAYGEQTSAQAALADIALATNSEFVWSNGTLTLVPFGDENVSGNGHSYTAPSAPEYSLGSNDFVMDDPNEGPVKLSRKRPADNYNSLKVECLDRNAQYNPAMIEAKDQAGIDLYGLRQDTSKNFHLFCDTTAARLSAQLWIQRQAVRNIYSFKLDQRYIRLDPMDIVAITDANLGLSEQWVRIIDIEENEDGSLSFTAEEYLNGTGNAPNYSYQAWDGFNADYNAPPGDANVPIIFEAPVQIATTGLETWIAASGSVFWGGCEVWVSTDGNTYAQAGVITGGSRQGVLTADFPASESPDTTNTLSVDLTESQGSLLSGTHEDANQANTLCYVDGELIAYQAATLTSDYNYDLGTYITRGLYNTEIASHADGSAFARLDSSVFKYTYDKTQIGQTIYVKLLSYNIYGGGLQSLADVDPYTHTIIGPPIPPDVTNFSAQQSGGAVVFSWTEVNDFALKGYDILYGEQDGTIDNATFLTESARGTEMTNASVPPGTWRFYIRARDVADQFSSTPSTYDLIVENDSPIIFTAPQPPDFPGTVDGFVRHFSGVLIPTSTKMADDYTQIPPPSAPTLGETSGGSLTGATYYVKVTYLNQYGSETTPSSESSQVVATNNLLVVTSPSSSTGAVAYNVYVSTVSNTEQQQNVSPMSIGTDWTLPTSGLVSGATVPTTNSTGWEVFDWYVPDVVATSEYTTNTFDTGFDDTLRIWSFNAYQMGYNQSGVPDIATSLDTWLTGELDPDVYNPWVIGLIEMRYARMRLTLNNVQGTLVVIDDFTVTADRTPRVEEGDSITVAPGGSTITFSQQFHENPLIQVTVVSSSALLPTAASITTTGFTAHVFNTSGADVGGVINWEAKGE